VRKGNGHRGGRGTALQPGARTQRQRHRTSSDIRPSVKLDIRHKMLGTAHSFNIQTLWSFRGLRVAFPRYLCDQSIFAHDNQRLELLVHPNTGPFGALYGGETPPLNREGPFIGPLPLLLLLLLLAVSEGPGVRVTGQRKGFVAPQRAGL
jgi:hypothetical protein